MQAAFCLFLSYTFVGVGHIFGFRSAPKNLHINQGEKGKYEKII